MEVKRHSTLSIMTPETKFLQSILMIVKIKNYSATFFFCAILGKYLHRNFEMLKQIIIIKTEELLNQT